MNCYRLFFSLSVLTPGLVWTVFDARAQTCAQAPSCSELGYTKAVADCAGKNMIKCPFDQTKVFCQDDVAITCASLGFTDTLSSCKGEYVKCPSDSTKGKCINGPKVGDLKYSLNSSNHDGWLLCNGNQYSQTTYSKLYNVIRTNFCSARNGGCASGQFAVPDYRGFFLRGYSSPTSLTSTYQAYSGTWNYSTTTPQQEQLPNLKGGFGLQGKSSMDGTLFSEGTSYREGQANGNVTSRSAMFNASKYNSIYNGNHVIPGNYGTYIFIYAGQ